MNGENQKTQTKKSSWGSPSPKLMFVFGLVAGIAIFATLSLLYSFLSLTKIDGAPKVAVTNNQEVVNQTPQTPSEAQEPTGTPVGTFIDTGKDLCKENGKPIIRLFSTTWCPHCQWIKETFDKVASDYVKKGKIVAYHWELDTGDNALTKTVESATPAEEEAIFNEFNPRGSIPTFIFGCRYYRIGNGYEREGESGKVKEEEEFRALIEEILRS